MRITKSSMSGWPRWTWPRRPVVCLRTPDPKRAGRFVNRIWDDVPATRARIAELGAELGERYARIARRRGKAIAQVAVARSIMIIAWHLLSDPQARYRDLGPDWHARRTNRDKKIRTHLQGLQALGVTVAITGDEQAA